jgi:hypothetical protein
LAGAAGNVEGESERNGTGVALGLRVDVTLRQGIWLALDFGWTLVQERRAELLSLHTGTPRLIAGLSVGPETWAVRFGLGWTVEGWWTTGGAEPRGWRMGGTLVLSACWRPLDWLSVGGEFGMDLFRTRIEVDYGSEPLFGLGHWRWRTGAWAAVQFAGL